MLADMNNIHFVQIDVVCPSCKTEFTAREQIGELQGTTIVDTDDPNSKEPSIEDSDKGIHSLSPTDGHAHTVQLDANGDGTSSEQDQHAHKVLGWKVQSAKGHVHDLDEGAGAAGELE